MGIEILLYLIGAPFTLKTLLAAPAPRVTEPGWLSNELDDHAGLASGRVTAQQLTKVTP